MPEFASDLIPGAFAPDVVNGTAAPSGHVTASPAQTAVVDGETLRLHNTVIRLLGVRAPERGRWCHRDDGTGSDCGAAAANALAALVSGRGVACELHGEDDQHRALGICHVSSKELNHELVAAGWARAERFLPGLKDEEAAARRARRGLWSYDDATAR